mmetsp:Transcript_3009/g.3448  ORF Transcript_3009/g.3448 Transcript_3009/m.3448 type:complete len:99 (-) Transcript_3009:494-790(-)
MNTRNLASRSIIHIFCEKSLNPMVYQFYPSHPILCCSYYSFENDLQSLSTTTPINFFCENVPVLPHSYLLLLLISKTSLLLQQPLEHFHKLRSIRKTS